MGNESDVVFCLQTLRNVVFETSLGNLTAANVSADSPLTGTGRGKAAWPYLVRIAPGGKVCADARDKVSFASSTGDRASRPALFDNDKDKNIGDGPNPKASDPDKSNGKSNGLKPGERSSLLVRITGVELRLIGETRGDERDAVDLNFGLAASIHGETSGDCIRQVSRRVRRANQRRGRGGHHRDGRAGAAAARGCQRAELEPAPGSLGGRTSS